MAAKSDGGSRKTVAIFFAVLAVLLAFYVLHSNLSGTGFDPNSTMYVDAETGKAFLHHNVVGEEVPVYSPSSGKNTGYPGEPCYWTASGEQKKDPTWVLLNQSLGKPGPTFCPDCGRLVVPRNPAPGPNSTPPPTREEWMQRHPGVSPG